MERIFIDINDAGRTILNYVSSEEFEKDISAIDLSNGRNNFIAGLAMAVIVIMANCPRYVAQEMEK